MRPKNKIAAADEKEKFGLQKYNKTDSYIKTKFIEFCKRTDLHGYKYIVMQDLPLIERSCWAAAIVISVMCAGFLVVSAYKWYARNPIVTVIESTHGPIWDIPFPAVTVCDLNLISRKAARSFADEATLPDNITSDELYTALRYAPYINSNYETAEMHRTYLHSLQQVIDANNMSTMDLFDLLAPAKSCTDLIERCMWKNTMYRCELLFHKIFTRFSRCCTFNYYGSEESEEFRPNEVFQPRTPRRVASCGYQTALTLILNTDSDDYYSASIASFGAIVFIDNAYNVPSLNSPMRLVGPNTEVFIALSPESTYATSGIRAFSPKERQCYFTNEVNLGKIKQYSYHNCLVYKKMKQTQESCGCVPFYSRYDEGNRICNFTDLDCLEKVRASIEKNLLDNKISLKCLPDCEHYDYNLEVALGFLATNIPLDGLSFYKDVNLENRSLLNIFFNDLVTTRYRRDVYLNWQNLLASFGGLLSLLLGFTLISAFDFVIFFTFKIVYDCLKTAIRPGSELDAIKAKGNVKNNMIFVKDAPQKDPWFQQRTVGNASVNTHRKY